MSIRVETRPVVIIHERMARCLVEEVLRGRKSDEEVLRGKLTGSFRFIPTSTDAPFLANDYALLKQELTHQINDLFQNKKSPRYECDHIDVEPIENTIGLDPVIKTRLQITLTVMLLPPPKKQLTLI